MPPNNTILSASPSRAEFARRLMTSALTLAMVVVFLVTFLLRQSYRSAEEVAAITANNYSEELQEIIDNIIAKSELSLFAVADEIKRQITAGGIDEGTLNEFMGRQQARLQEIEGLHATDSEGLLRYGLGIPPGARINLSDSDYFSHFREHDGGKLFISKPLKSRITGKWNIILALRLNRPTADGQGRPSAGRARDGDSPAREGLVPGEPGMAQERPTAREGLVPRAPGMAQERPTAREGLVPRAPGMAQERPDSTFAGVAYTTVLLEYITNNFSTIDVGKQGVIALFDDTPAVIARYPEPDGIGSAIGKKPASPKFAELLQSAVTVATYRAVSSIDHIERTFSTRKVGAYPLYISVGLARADYIAGWRQEVAITSALVVLFLLLLLTAKVLLLRSWQAQETTMQALQASEEKYRQLFEAESDAIFIIDNESGRIYDVNSAAEKNYGYSRDELLARFNTDLSAEPDKTRQAMAEHIGAIPIRWHRKKDGTVFPVEIMASFLTWKGRPVHIAAIRDVSARLQAEASLLEKSIALENLTHNLEKQVEEEIELRSKNERILVQQSKLAAMGEMLGAIAHQWRQPLNSLGLVIQNLSDTYDYGELTKEYLDRAVGKSMAQIQHMSKTIDDFRNFFRPDKEKATFDTMAAVGDVLRLLSAQLTANDVDYRLTCCSHGRTFERDTDIVLCDAKTANGYRNEFEHVILNLINNAREAIIEKRHRDKSAATPRGLITFDFYHSREKIVIEVGDNGGGIPDDIIDRVFEPYFTTKNQAKGTGLGLYMSKVIMEHMNGALSVLNGDEGAIFTLELPGCGGGEG